MDTITALTEPPACATSSAEAPVGNVSSRVAANDLNATGNMPEWDCYLQQSYTSEPAPSHLPQHKTAPSADVGWLDALMASAV